MKFLFVMHYPGYLRYYDSTVRELAARGHEVLIAFDSPGKQAEGLEALKDGPKNIRVLGPTPRRRDVWTALAASLRTAVDFARYLHPRYARADYLRDRMESQLSPLFRPLGWVRSLPVAALNRLLRFFALLEDAVPVSPVLAELLAEHRPDALLVTPLVTDGSTQVDLVKAAKARGVPTGLCVASWDHLTTKGLIRLVPDGVYVWNERQKEEATEFHGVAPEKVVVTGAQPFDKWFDRAPSRDREAFCRRVGLDPAKPFLLFVGSTASISEPAAEIDFVRRWVRALRGSSDPAVNGLGVLIRPHPYNPGFWAEADFSGFANVAVWPKGGANPVDEGDRADYFDSFAHGAAVVGINTSAMIEAAIVGRPVFTLLPEEFDDTQTGTLHFQYLLPENGGFLEVARTLEEHVAQLARTLADPERVRTRIRTFVASFIRPRGLDRACTPALAEALERLAGEKPARSSASLAALALRPALFAAGVVQTTFRKALKPRKKKDAPKAKPAAATKADHKILMEKSRVR
jgi:hypothetical protein